MVSNIVNYRWNYKYPKRETYKVQPIKNEKKSDNNPKERNMQ